MVAIAGNCSVFFGRMKYAQSFAIGWNGNYFCSRSSERGPVCGVHSPVPSRLKLSNDSLPSNLYEPLQRRNRANAAADGIVQFEVSAKLS